MLRHLSLARMSATLDGEASVAEQAAVASHVASCERCARRFEGLRRTASAVRGLAAVTAREAAPASLQARVRVGVAAGRHQRFTWRWAEAGEAVLGSLLAATGTAALASMVVLLYVQPASGFADGGRLRERLVEVERIESFERLLDAGSAPSTRPASRLAQSRGAR